MIPLILTPRLGARASEKILTLKGESYGLDQSGF